MANRLSQLQGLADSMPQWSQPSPSQASTQGIQAQQALAQAPAAAGTPGGVASLAAGLTAAKVQPAVQATQRVAQQATQLAGSVGQEQSTQTRLGLIAQQSQLAKLSGQVKRDLDSRNSQLANRVISDRLRFRRDEAGRLTLNAMQADDLLVATARSQEEAKIQLQKIKYAGDVQLAYLRALYNRLSSALSDASELRQLEAKGVTQRQIAQKMAELKAYEAEQTQESQRRAGMISGGSQLVGVGIMAAVAATGPVGWAAAGAAGVAGLGMLAS